MNAGARQARYLWQKSGGRQTVTIVDIETRDSRFQVVISEKPAGGYLARYLGVRPREALPADRRVRPHPASIIADGAVEAESLADLATKYRAVVVFHAGDIVAERLVAAGDRPDTVS